MHSLQNRQKITKADESNATWLEQIHGLEHRRLTPSVNTMWKLQVCPCKCSGWSYPWPIFPTGVKSSSQAICGDHQRRLACDHGTLRPTGHYNMLLKLLKTLGWSKSSSQDGHFEPWNLRCTNRNLYRCKDCNMIPANTWPGWLPAVQCLPSSYLQWKHTETCRQLPLVQPFVSLVAPSDWNQVPPITKLPVLNQNWKHNLSLPGVCRNTPASIERQRTRTNCHTCKVVSVRVMHRISWLSAWRVLLYLLQKHIVSLTHWFIDSFVQAFWSISPVVHSSGAKSQRICKTSSLIWTLQWVAHGLPFMRSQLDATKACPDVWSQGIAYIIASSYLSMFAQLWLAMKTQSMWRQERCAQLNCSKPVLRPRDLFCSRQHWMTRIPIRNFWTHKRTKNLYKLAGESGSQVARAHSCLTGRLAQTSFMAMQFGVFLHFSSPPTVNNCSVH